MVSLLPSRITSFFIPLAFLILAGVVPYLRAMLSIVSVDFTVCLLPPPPLEEDFFFGVSSEVEDFFLGVSSEDEVFFFGVSAAEVFFFGAGLSSSFALEGDVLGAPPSPRDGGSGSGLRSGLEAAVDFTLGSGGATSTLERLVGAGSGGISSAWPEEAEDALLPPCAAHAVM